VFSPLLRVHPKQPSRAVFCHSNLVGRLSSHSRTIFTTHAHSKQPHMRDVSLIKCVWLKSQPSSSNKPAAISTIPKNDAQCRPLNKKGLSHSTWRRYGCCSRQIAMPRAGFYNLEDIFLRALSNGRSNIRQREGPDTNENLPKYLLNLVS